MCSISENARIAFEPILQSEMTLTRRTGCEQGDAYDVWLVDVETPRHAVDRVLQQVDAIGVQFIIPSSNNVRDRNFSKGETLFMVFREFSGHET